MFHSHLCNREGGAVCFTPRGGDDEARCMHLLIDSKCMVCFTPRGGDDEASLARDGTQGGGDRGEAQRRGVPEGGGGASCNHTVTDSNRQ